MATFRGVGEGGKEWRLGAGNENFITVDLPLYGGSNAPTDFLGPHTIIVAQMPRKACIRNEGGAGRPTGLSNALWRGPGKEGQTISNFCFPSTTTRL